MVASTDRAVRVCETSHPPVYYVPREDVAAVPPLDGRVAKVEGLALRAVRDGDVHLLAVVDDDDPTRPSTALELHVDLG